MLRNAESIAMATTSSEKWAGELAKVLKRHRKRAGLSRRELSELTGIGMTALYQLENGHSTVRLATLMAVLEGLNIKLRLFSALEGEISL